MPRLTVNGRAHEIDAPDELPLLWALRDHLGLTGTKYGCGIAVCGACTVLIDGQPRRSCVTPVGSVAGEVTTVEGLAAADGTLSKVQAAWVAEQAPQCGYCQSGQILAATALLSQIAQPSDADIDAALAGNLCRCGAYPRIRRAIHRAAGAAPDTPLKTAGG